MWMARWLVVSVHQLNTENDTGSIRKLIYQNSYKLPDNCIIIIIFLQNVDLKYSDVYKKFRGGYSASSVFVISELIQMTTT